MPASAFEHVNDVTFNDFISVGILLLFLCFESLNKYQRYSWLYPEIYEKNTKMDRNTEIRRKAMISIICTSIRQFTVPKIF